MNTDIYNVLMGLMTSVLSNMVFMACKQAGNFLVGDNLQKKLALEKTALRPLLGKAAERLAEETNWKGTGKWEEVCLYLSSPECELIVRQIFSSQFSGKEQSQTLTNIKRSFIDSLAIFIQEVPEKISGPAEILFAELIKACELSLAHAVDSGILSGHEAKSASRHHDTMGEFKSLQIQLSMLAKENRPSLESILEFEEKYRRQVANRHRHITPPHLDSARKVPINKLYVSPFLIPPDKSKQRHVEEEISLNAFLRCVNRTVLLGSPGSGKSTTMEKICHDLASKYNKRLSAHRELTPILVTLREYGAAKQAQNSSIVDFIETTANSNYQLKPVDGAIEYFLSSGRAIVLFDGLDELTDTTYRKTISDDVESFANLYPSVPVVVTSRVVGYEKAPLDESKFDVFSIADFEEEQVEEYANKWFDIDTDIPLIERKQRAVGFLEESEKVPDLRANPLMLALMCNLYRGAGYIPKNRPDVYERCSMLLFDRDKTKDLHIDIPFESHMKATMMALAHWIYSDPKLQAGVTEKMLLNQTTSYLCQQVHEHREDAEVTANAFIRFCRGRAWIFTDTGTTAEGEKLYQFTHRTFLEYFTAAFIVRTSETPKKLEKTLFPRIAKREWDIVAQLAFQLQNESLQGSGSTLLYSLIEKSRKSSGTRSWNMLSFTARCLEFLLPHQNVVREIVDACVSHSVEYNKEYMTENMSSPNIPRRVLDSRLRRRGTLTIDLMSSLLGSATENRELVIEYLREKIVKIAQSPDNSKSAAALDIGMRLSFSDFRSRRIPKGKSLEEIESEIVRTCAMRIDGLSKKYFSICFQALRFTHNLDNLVKLYGIHSLFVRVFSANIGGFYPSIAQQTLANGITYITEKGWGEEQQEMYRQCKRLGPIFLSVPPPWVSSEIDIDVRFMGYSIEDRYFLVQFDDKSDKYFKVDATILFPLFVLFAHSFEAFPERIVKEFIHTNSSEIYPAIARFRNILCGRFGKVDTAIIEREIVNCGYNVRQANFIRKWVKKEINIIAERQGR